MPVFYVRSDESVLATGFARASMLHKAAERFIVIPLYF
jgi:hypothetical protein